jgi:hypothetical protein
MARVASAFPLDGMTADSYTVKVPARFGVSETFTENARLWPAVVGSVSSNQRTLITESGTDAAALTDCAEAITDAKRQPMIRID